MKRVEVNYVVGFIFNEAGTHVLLIKKDKPQHPMGLNGLGGKIEPNESVPYAIAREVWEEAHWRIPPSQWNYFLKLSVYYISEIRNIYYFRSFQPKVDTTMFEQMTREELTILPVGALMSAPVVPHLKWAIPLALNRTIVFPVMMEDFNNA